MDNQKKIALIAGRDNWHTRDFPEEGIPVVTMSDGPHGLRVEKEAGIGFPQSVPAVAWPVLSALGCSFDTELIHEIGTALAEECIAEGVDVLLAPGINHKRNPLCGRNFEYFSEDPVVSGELGSAYVNGLQENGIGASLKHYAANSREEGRLVTDSIVEERTLHEIYLRAFDTVIHKAKPWTMMMAYNMLNGIYCCENEFLMKHARKEGFDGVFVSDWGGVSDPAASLIHGLNLIMPGDHHADAKVQEALEKGILSQDKLDESVRCISDLAKKVSHHSPKPYDIQKHLDLALKAAEESIVLLKNDGVLPVKKEQSFLLVGNLLKMSNHGGNGSSKVEAISVDHVTDIFDKRKINYAFYSGKSIEKTIRLAKEKDIVIIGAGYYENEESEGYDRKNMRLSSHQNRLIRELCNNHDHVIVVIQTGSPVEMPWKEDAEGILYMNLTGCRGGSALTNILFGMTCPSARLAETFPQKLEDVPSYAHFSDNPHQMEYREGIFTGYRYYDTFDIPVNYGFGHGLSYTHFSYSDLKTGDYSVSFTLKNDGDYDARNTVCLYIGFKDSSITRAAKELKAFQSVYLKKGEEKRIVFNLDESMFQYYDIQKHDWMIEEGMYQLMIGGAVNEIFLQTEMYHEGIQNPYSSIQKEFYEFSEGKLHIEKTSFEKMLGRQIPQFKNNIDADSSLKDLELHTFRFLAKVLSKKKELLPGVRLSTIQETPLRQILMADQKITWETIDGMVELLNGMPVKGIKKVLKSLKSSRL